MGLDPEGAERHVPGQQLVGVGGPESSVRPRSSASQPRGVLNLATALGGPRRYPAQPFEPGRDPAAPAPEPLGQPVDQVPDHPGEEDHRPGAAPEDAEDRRGCRGRGRRATGRAAAPWSQRLARRRRRWPAGPRCAKKAMVAMKLMRVQGHRHRERHPVPPHGVHHHRGRARLERREVRRPGAHPAGEKHPLERRVRDDVPGHDPDAEPPADPVHRRQPEPHQHPEPVDPGHGRRGSAGRLLP